MQTRLVRILLERLLVIMEQDQWAQTEDQNQVNKYHNTHLATNTLISR